MQTSCGFAVPYLTLKPDENDPNKQVPYLEDRETLGHWGSKQIEAGLMNDYRAQKNSRSLDGLPGLRRARRDAKELVWLGDLRSMIVPRDSAMQTVTVAILSMLLTIISLYAAGLLNL